MVAVLLALYGLLDVVTTLIYAVEGAPDSHRAFLAAVYFLVGGALLWFLSARLGAFIAADLDDPPTDRPAV